MKEEIVRCLKLADGSVGMLVPIGRAFDPEKDGLRALQEGGIFSRNIVPSNVQPLNEVFGEVTMVQITTAPHVDPPGFISLFERLNFATGQPAGTPPWR